MTTLSSSDLEYMRSSIELLFPDTCNVLSNSGTADAMGGKTDAWGTALTSVSCRLDTISGNAISANGGLVSFQKLVFSMPHDTAVTTANRIVHSSNTYNVIAVNIGSWLACKRAEVELI